MTAIQLIVGLGNPGPEYDQTRHNAGALFVERLADSQRVSLALDKKYFGLVGKFSHQGRDVRLLIPTTYMNRSGQAVAALANFFRIPVDAMLVAHDELDMPPGVAKLKLGGGHGGKHIRARRKEGVFELRVQVEADVGAAFLGESKRAKDEVRRERPGLRAVVRDLLDVHARLFERLAAHRVLERLARLNKAAG